MKKMFLTLLLVAGSLGFQTLSAQNNISLVAFTQNDGDRFALAYGNNTEDTCVDSTLSPSVAIVYTFNVNTGALSRGGNLLRTYPSHQRNAVDGLFNGDYYRLYRIDGGFNLLARDSQVATYQE